MRASSCCTPASPSGANSGDTSNFPSDEATFDTVMYSQFERTIATMTAITIMIPRTTIITISTTPMLTSWPQLSNSTFPELPMRHGLDGIQRLH